MNYTEHPALFTCENQQLLGLLTKPELPAQTGVVVIVGGPQYRVGSHRQFVLLSRRLAAAGYAVLRFDYRGMGDSEGPQQDFQTVSADIAAAIDTLQQGAPSVQQIVLWGLCDAASAALLYCHTTQDPRVRGLCLLNPWVRSEASLARTQVKHYYTRRLRQKEFWVKLLHGKVALGVLKDLLKSIRLMVADPVRHPSPQCQPFQQRMGTAWCAFSGTILLLLSDDDDTAREFLEYGRRDAVWTQALTHPRLIRHDVLGADHTFSNAASRATVETLTLTWLESQVGARQDRAATEFTQGREPFTREKVARPFQSPQHRPLTQGRP